MSMAKNKLQDIYDAGVIKLGELERAQRDTMNEGATTSVSSAAAGEKEVKQTIESRSKEAESDIAAFLSRSVAKIEKVIESETQKTTAHLTYLTHGLTSLTEKLSDSIKLMRESHESELSVLSEDVADRYGREFENASADLQKRDFGSSKNMKVQNTFNINSFQQKLDHGLLEVRGEEKNYTSRLFKAFLQTSTAIDSASSTASQNLSAEYDTHAKELEEKFETGAEEMLQLVQEFVAGAEQQATDLAQKIHELCERETFDLKAAGDEKAAEFGKQLTGLHEATAGDITSQVEELAQSLDAVAGGAKALLTAAATEIRQKVDNSIGTAEAECQRRVEASLRVQQDLEETSSTFLQKNKQDLDWAQKGFEERLALAVAAAEKKLEDIAKKSEETITGARKAAEKEMGGMADAASSQIQVTLQAFLDRVKEKRNAALDQVNRAASGNPQDAEAQPVKEEKKAKNPKAKDKGAEPTAGSAEE